MLKQHKLLGKGLKINRTVRFRNYSAFAVQENVCGIPPGIYKVDNFITTQEHDDFCTQLRNIQSQIDDYIKNYDPSKKDIYISQHHNLTSQESFQKVKVTNPTSTKNQIENYQEHIYVEVFEKYGEEGHVLVYCRNKNIPQFIINDIIEKKMLQNDKVREIINQNVRNQQNIDWKITLNYYNPIERNNLVEYAGFPFHRDIASNGNITGILTLGSPGLIEFKRTEVEYDGFKPKEEQSKEKNYNSHEGDCSNIYRTLLDVNSLLILSGESRWNYLHRVVPTAKEFEFEGKIYKREQPRMTIVFGCK
ncbi:hypothetical protein ABK040_015723 [Willaertia magna]